MKKKLLAGIMALALCSTSIPVSYKPLTLPTTPYV